MAIASGSRDIMRVNAITVGQVEEFVRTWLEADSAVVLDWQLWEQNARQFFFPEDEADGREMTLREMVGRPLDLMHQVMLIAVAVCTGTIGEVKRALREATPRALETANLALGHLPQFSAVLRAELHFRLGDLACDWALKADGDGRCLVTSEFRDRSAEH